MTDRQIESLVRMAVEIDALEQSAADRRRATQSANGPGPVWTLADARAAAPPGDNRGWTRRRLIGLGAAAAAACFAMMTPPRGDSGPVPTRFATPADIRFVSMAEGPGADAPQHLLSTGDRGSFVLAALAEWSGDCDCLRWRLHEWEHGGLLAQANAGQTLGITVLPSDRPPAERLLVVAASHSAADLPATVEEADDLLACLNGAAGDDGCITGNAASYASAVQKCLPVGVTVVQRSLIDP